MGNWTKVILIPPILDSDKFPEYCNDFLKEEYTEDKGWDSPFIFKSVETPFSPDVLVGHFAYFNEHKFIKHLRQWFNPVPVYEVVDENEKPSKYASQLYHQTNDRWGTIQLFIQGEHDDTFWLVNIGKEGIESFGHLENGG